jgi:hypothetical protein
MKSPDPSGQASSTQTIPSIQGGVLAITSRIFDLTL